MISKKECFLYMLIKMFESKICIFNIWSSCILQFIHKLFIQCVNVTPKYSIIYVIHAVAPRSPLNCNARLLFLSGLRAVPSLTKHSVLVLTFF